MVRALVLCALVLAVRSTYGQNATGFRATVAPEPTVAVAEATPIVAGNEQHTAASGASGDMQSDSHALLRHKLAEINCLQAEIDELRRATGTPQQILVKLEVLEVSRTKLRTLKTDFSFVEGSDIVDGQQITSLVDGNSSGFRIIDNSAALDGFLKWLKQNNIAKVVAEPSLVTVSGRPASFKTGAEIPVPAVQGANQPPQPVHCGTEVDVLAVAQGQNRVHLDLRARISDEDHSRSIDVGGAKVPALNVRQTSSAINLTFGQTAVSSGMVERRTERIKYADGRVADVEHEIEVLFLVKPEAIYEGRPTALGAAADGNAYHTATTQSDIDPKERSLRVPTPYTPR